MSSELFVDALALLTAGRDLSAERARSAVLDMLDGRAGEIETSAVLTALRMKGETADELAGATEAVRERMSPFEVNPSLGPLLDTCGTGGDSACSINVSTAAAIVVAACGVKVAKHGNRSSSGNSGSAEVLSELGIDIEASDDVLKRCLETIGLAFFFAPRFHPGFKQVGEVRKRLPFRTLFNLIGPLANPARPSFQIMGVPDEPRAELLAATLSRLGSTRRAAVVFGEDGLDEVTLSGPTHVFWLETNTSEPAAITRFQWTPRDFGLPVVSKESLRVTGPAENARRLTQLLSGVPGPDRHIVLANASAGLLVAGRVSDLREGVRVASKAIDSGEALRLLNRWSSLTRSA